MHSWETNFYVYGHRLCWLWMPALLSVQCECALTSHRMCNRTSCKRVLYFYCFINDLFRCFKMNIAHYSSIIKQPQQQLNASIQTHFALAHISKSFWKLYAKKNLLRQREAYLKLAQFYTIHASSKGEAEREKNNIKKWLLKSETKMKRLTKNTTDFSCAILKPFNDPRLFLSHYFFFFKMSV